MSRQDFETPEAFRNYPQFVLRMPVVRDDGGILVGAAVGRDVTRTLMVNRDKGIGAMTTSFANWFLTGAPSSESLSLQCGPP